MDTYGKKDKAHVMGFVVVALFSVLCSPNQGLSFPSVGKAPQTVEDRFLPEGDSIKVQSWVEELEIPWSLVFLPQGDALVSERPGRIRLIKGGKLLHVPYATLEVVHEGEGGLMGLALHPDFPDQPYVYAMHTYGRGADRFNRVVRLRHLGDRAALDRVILDRIPGGRLHNGGRITFGPDKFLYITTGDTFDSDLAQGLGSLGGKVLRLSPEGEVPGENPFAGSAIYSYGHRNPQGLSFHPHTGELFQSEHGPSGEFLLFGNDEINVLHKGRNYGWPLAVGAPGDPSYEDPLVVWKRATPPSGICFCSGKLLPHLAGDLFVATLRSQALIRIQLGREAGRFVVKGMERWFAVGSFEGKYGRLRDIVEGPDGALYFLTSNRDGRGNPRKGDDRIYRITPR